MSGGMVFVNDETGIEMAAGYCLMGMHRTKDGVHLVVEARAFEVMTPEQVGHALKELVPHAYKAKESCLDEFERQEFELSKKRKQPRRAAPGHVYLAECDGHYKIGKSKKASARMAHFDTIYPKPVTLIAHAKFDDMDKAEADLHMQYSDCRVKGEWFDLTPEQVEAVKAVLS